MGNLFLIPKSTMWIIIVMLNGMGIHHSDNETGNNSDSNSNNDSNGNSDSNSNSL